MDTNTYTSAETFREVHETLNATFASGKTKSIEWRKWQLKQLWWLVHDNEQAILEALNKDLGRHEMETRTADLAGLQGDIIEHIQHVEEWAATEPIEGAGVLFGTLGGAHIRKEPLGVAFVIGAWNFPVLLTLQPVIAAVAAGCCVIIKPSELASASEKVIVELVNRYLDGSAIRAVTGGPKETSEFLTYRFDHIFFTGSTKIAKFVAAAAAKHLTPTVLELGGQCPAIITKTADVDLAAKRVAYAKFVNAGQICLSVNHVFVDPAIHHQFVDSLKRWTVEFGSSGQMCNIINERNYDRLNEMLEKTQGKVLCGENGSRETKRIPGTVVDQVTMSDSLLSEELFGPICPVLTATPNEAIAAINSLPRPLALYVFSNEQKEIDNILGQTISGGVTINDVLMHAAVPNAPFGGVGDSGMGSYHGRHGFDVFTHKRTVLALPKWLEGVMSFRYPTYDVKHASKFAVKNKLGFRRGETMADQRVGGFKGGKRLRKAFVWAAVLGAGLYWIDDIRSAKLAVLGLGRQLVGREL
ncbi:hypothetical protein PspLS_01746 [Pyricularia sp. CBS 133598]|nr:hypothetical protein PspLS_01746 [Pyricularia sp. CBS 133598]